MADTKLTVSMILNSASFTKQIQDINKKLKLTESEFKNAGAGVEKFENTTEGLTKKISSLTTKLDLQNTKISKYRDEIVKTKKDLDDTVGKYDKNKKKIEEVSAAYDEACQQYGKNSEEAKKLKEELDGLTKKHTNYENKIVSTNSRLTTLETELNNAEKEAKELGQQIEETSRRLDNFADDTARANLKQYGESLKEAGSKLEDIGKGFTEVAKKMATISVPLIGLGTASVKTAMTFEQGMSKVKAASGASAEELALLEQKARDVAKTSTKTATDCVDALGNLALAGYGTQDMLNALDPVIKMAEAGMLDLETASDLCVNAMSSLGKDSSELEGFLDVIAQTANSTTTEIDGMMEAFINVGASVRGLEIPFQEAAAALGVMGQNGTVGYEAGTKLNSILTRMTAQSKIASKAWKGLGIEVFDGEGKFRGLTTVLSETREKLKDYNDEQTQVFLKAVVGTDNINDFKNLVNATGGTLENLTQEMYNAKGALNEMTDTMKDNVAGQWSNIKAQMEELGLKIADTLLPILSDLLKVVSKVIEWFDGLPAPMQKFVVYAGMAFVAVNTLIMGLGLLITSMGAVKSGIGGMLIALAGSEGIFGRVTLSLAGRMGLTTALSGVGTAAAGAAGTAGMGGLIATLGTFASAALPWVAAAGTIYFAGKKIKESLSQEVIPEVDLFADKVETTSQIVNTSAGTIVTSVETTTTKISEATAKAVGAYIELDDGVRNTLFNMQYNSDVITSEIATDLTTKFQTMGTQIRDGFQEHMDENIGILNKFFEDSAVLSDTMEQDIITKTNEYYKKKMDKTKEYEDQILAIIKKAKDENRELTQKELDDISKLQDKMRDNAIESLSEQEVECNLIKERLKSYDNRVTAEMVSNNIKELNKQRDKAIEDANKTYDETVKATIKMRDETKTITAEQADMIIASAEKQRDESIDAAKKLRNDTVKEIKGAYSEVAKDVDLKTGEIMTDLDRLKNWWNNWKPSEKVLSIVNKVSEYITGTKSSSNASSGKKTKLIDDYVGNYMTGDYLTGTLPITDNLYIPSSNEMSAMVRDINSVTNPNIGLASKSGSNTINVVDNTEKFNALINQNNILIKLITQLINKDNNVYLDGREVARGIAPYKSEIDKYDMRNPRFVY